MMAALHTCVVRVNLFLFMEDAGQYQEYGSVGCAIIGTLSDPPMYKMGCYNEKNEYLCTTSITTNNETSASIALQKGGYVSFKDEEGRSWSMQFETEGHAIEFCAHISVAMYGASGRPDRSIVACDVTAGKCDRTVFASDVIKVRYQSWVIQCEDHQKGLPILGSRLDGNLMDEKPFTTTVPVNHLSVTPDMKGFEGMLIGMGEEGSRLVVIPLKAKRGGGPQVHMCFYIHLVKKKNLSHVVDQKLTAMSLVTSNLPVAGQAVVPRYSVKDDVVPRSRSPPPGLSREQLLVVDRLRDQVHVLSQQLQEARNQLDIFMNDVRVFERSAKPQSLANAQIEYSIQKLLSDTEEARELLSQKDLTLRQMESRNRDLQQKVDRFTAAANLLSEEKKEAINSSNEEKLDMDRRITQAQAQLTRLHSEREDVARHLSTVKRLLQVADEDIKNEKRNLQIASAALQSNEAKLAVLEENHAEKAARRKILESKVITLGDRLRSTLEEVRVKEGQIEERRKKIETDRLYYIELMEDERIKAAADVRELREEFTNEMALRERRYQEERQRVAQESFERGRLQGIEDGQAESLLEVDVAMQELTLNLQRRRAEKNAISIRLKKAEVLNQADECRLNSQLTALHEALVKLQSENSQLEAELHSLSTSKQEVENTIFTEIRTAIEQLSRSVGRDDLLTLMHLLRNNQKLDYRFEVQRTEEEQRALDEEYREVVEWVSSFVDNAHVLPPPMQMPHVCDELPVSEDAPIVISWNEGNPSEELVEWRLKDQMSHQEAALDFNPDEMNQRYQTLLSELMGANPDLALLPKQKLVSSCDVFLPEDLVSSAPECGSCSGGAEKLQSLHAEEEVEPSQIREGALLPPPIQQPQDQQEEQGKQERDECFPHALPAGVSVKLDGPSDPHVRQGYHPEDACAESLDDPGTVTSAVSNPEKSSLSHQNPKVPIRAKEITFSDSGSESDPTVREGQNINHEAPVTVAPRTKLLFNESDSSNSSNNQKYTTAARVPLKRSMPKRPLFDDSDSS